MSGLVFRWLLLLYPEAFRRELGADVLRTIEEKAAASPTRVGRWVLLVREAAGLARAAVAERRAGRERAAGRRRPHGRPRVEPMERARQEVAQATRRLLRSPSFSATALVTLALAIAANTAIFTMVWRVVLSPLPYPDANRLVAVEHAAPGFNAPSGMGMTTGLYREYGSRVPALESSAMVQLREVSVSGHGPEPERVMGALATPSLAGVLRTSPVLGRWFTADEGAPGGVSVAVLSHGFWQIAFGGDREVVGRTITVEGVTAEIVGVMPPRFDYPRPDMSLWLPLRLDPAAAQPGGFNYSGVGRLRADATVADVRSQMDAVIARLPLLFEGDVFAPRLVEEAKLAAAPLPLKERVVGGIERALWILLGAVALVLLVACANVATLFLARLEGRQTELAVRRALGAGRGRLATHFLAESGVLALVAGALGAVLAAAGVRALVLLTPVPIPRLHEVRVDGAVLLFTLGLSVIVTLLFGALPLLQRSGNLSGMLREAGRGTAGRGRLRARSALVGAQTAVAVMLLVASGLLLRSFQRLMDADPGFATESRLVFRVGLPGARYGEIDASSAFHHALLDRIRALPGVVRATATTCTPLSGICFADPLWVEGRDPSDGLPPVVGYRRVGDDFVRTMGMGLIGGRDLTEADRIGGDPVVVNQALVDAYFPNENPVGRRVHPGLFGDGQRWLTIVGVVENSATYSLQEERPQPQAFLPLNASVQGSTPWPHTLTYVVETGGPPLALLAQVRRELAELDDAIPLADAGRMEDIVADDAADLAFTMVLLGVAAALGLLLGLVGTYGTISYTVAQRQSEIGLRLALGARPQAVAGMVLRQGSTVAAAGVVAGILGALALSRVLEAVLYRVSARDPATYASVAALLLGLALLASWLPARRAAAVDPAVALRAD